MFRVPQTTLEIVNSESDLQKRLALLVEHGFKFQASQLIWDMARRHTAMFHYDWFGENFCKPLLRVTDKSSAVYVIITTRSKLDYHPAQRKEDEQHIVFELGWERKALGWAEEESHRLANLILAQALVRPLNHWSLKQAEGTGRATRQLLPVNDPVAREIAALHLVYHLREADFGRIWDFLVDIDGFPFDGGSKPFDESGLVNWIVERLLDLDWTLDRIRKELVEWIWLKKGTWPKWLLALAQTKVLGDNDEIRAVAVRQWIRERFGYLLEVSSLREDERKKTEEVWRQLFTIGKIGVEDREWISDLLVAKMASGNLRSVLWFLGHFGQDVGLHRAADVQERAIEVAVKAGNYGIAVALVKQAGGSPDRAWIEIVEIRCLSTELDQD